MTLGSKRNIYEGLITWRISARLGGAETLLRLHNEFQHGLKYYISLGAKYKIVCEKSPENQNGTENTNREKRRIASLVV